jgi:hypothetical protein
MLGQRRPFQVGPNGTQCVEFVGRHAQAAQITAVGSGSAQIEPGQTDADRPGGAADFNRLSSRVLPWQHNVMPRTTQGRHH